MRSYGYTRIRQLPESKVLSPTDYMVMENDNDTWKVLVSTFNQYISESIDIFEGDISGIIDNKFNDIQLILNENQELLTIINGRMEDYANEEKIRQENEAERIKNEGIRQNSYDEITGSYNDWTEEEKIRKANEEARKAAEAQRIADENIRISNEDTRKVNETNRGIAEAERVTHEDQRIVDENIRISNENTRITNFNRYTGYFDALEESVNMYKKEGLSQASSSLNKITKILEVALPISADHDYEALIHISTSSTDEAFIGLNLHLEKSGTTVNDGILSIIIPNRYKDTVNVVDFQGSFRIDTDGQIIVSIEYKMKTDNTKVKTAIVWDNITIFKEYGVSIYSVAPDNQPCNKEFIFNGVLTNNTVAATSAPQGFINILNNIEKEMQAIVDAIKPFKMFPVGSIYQTTSTQNPSVLLGGGTWTMLYNDLGITERVTIDNTESYSPVIYYWERIA